MTSVLPWQPIRRHCRGATAAGAAAVFAACRLQGSERPSRRGKTSRHQDPRDRVTRHGGLFYDGAIEQRMSVASPSPGGYISEAARHAEPKSVTTIAAAAVVV